MRATFFPSTARGCVDAPPSKSVSHRLLLCAGLAQGESILRGLAPSEDVLATCDCLTALGASVCWAGDAVRIVGTEPAKAGNALLPCRESASTLRFFLPLCLLGGVERTLSGRESLLRRPLSVYEELFARQGITLRKTAHSVTVRGTLRPGEWTLSGGVSSQFVSGLLFALPLLAEDSVLRLQPPVESRGYIGLTLDALRKFGVTAGWRDGLTLAIPGGQRYLPQNAEIEGDWSNAAPLLAIGGQVRGLRADSLQPDRACGALFHALDADCATVDLRDCPDLAPTLFAYAALRHGGVFTGTRRLRFKESDRAAVMAKTLSAFGAETEIDENCVRVGTIRHAPNVPLSSCGDHRIAMACAILLARTGGVLCGAEAVSKSFPDFFARLQALEIDIRLSELDPETPEETDHADGI